MKNSFQDTGHQAMNNREPWDRKQGELYNCPTLLPSKSEEWEKSKQSSMVSLRRGSWLSKEAEAARVHLAKNQKEESCTTRTRKLCRGFLSKYSTEYWSMHACKEITWSQRKNHLKGLAEKTPQLTQD